MISKSINNITLDNSPSYNNNLNNKVNSIEVLKSMNNNSHDFALKIKKNNIQIKSQNYQSNIATYSEINLISLENKNDKKEQTGNSKVELINTNPNNETYLLDKGHRSFSARNINCLKSQKKKGHIVPTVKTNLYEDEIKNTNENSILNSDQSEKNRQGNKLKTLSEARKNKFNQSSSSEDIGLNSPSKGKELIETFVNKLKIIKNNYNSNNNIEESSMMPEIQAIESAKDNNFEIIDVKEEYNLINYLGFLKKRR